VSTTATDERWQIWIDTGGTFTDGVALAPDGHLRRVKILSTSALRGRIVRSLAPDRAEIRESWGTPGGLIRGFRFHLLEETDACSRVADYDPVAKVLQLDRPSVTPLRDGAPFEITSPEEAPLLAARILTGTEASEPLPPSHMRLATTLGTNALLERRGVPTALFITEGFGDLLRIGTQQRPDLFRLDVELPAPLYEEVIEVPERLDAEGRVLRPLVLETLVETASALVDRGITTAAVALLHAYRNPDHEQQLKRKLFEWGFEHVSCSAELAPRIKLLPRAQTAVVDAYLSPVVGTYLARVGAGLSSGELLAMTSAGGLLDTERYRPKDSLLSGPAGGVVGAAHAGRRAGRRRIISFDMGGTSTDVARIDDDYEYRYEHRVGDAQMVAPALAIETVAAGGGSICWLDGERLRVGPHSAGARPGPACYGAGGPLTLTDVNLLLGRLDPERFDIPIDPQAARNRLDELLQELERRTGERARPGEVLEGLLAIANETMADAIRRISVRRGYDPTGYTLAAFGGAGGQHACGVAERLGMTRVVLPPDAALLSALGLGHAVVERFVERQVLEPLERSEPRLGEWMEALAARAREEVLAAGVAGDRVRVRRRLLHLRFQGQDSTLQVDWEDGLDARRAFEEAYAEMYGHRPEDRPVELESIRVVASSTAEVEDFVSGDLPVHEISTSKRLGELPTYDRPSLRPGARFDGPAVVLERHCATVVDRDWAASILGDGSLFLERGATRREANERGRPESIRLELFTQRFTSLVKEMGERLERTAVSTNVKERLDFSCALLDPDGSLVVNAPHIPVHLGALGLCVRRLKQTLPLRPGDVAVTNHPSFGGSHLPDITVVTPVYTEESPPRLLGYLASRAHHAEVGGSRPGSMPPTATHLVEEGVVIPPSYLIEGGRPRWDDLRRHLLQAPYPTRNVEDNLADLRAAAAANHAGARALRALAALHGAGTVLRYMERLERMADERIREALKKFGDGVYEAEERLDDGSALHARIELRGGRARIDFGGSAGVHPGNLNATPAIVQSAVIYVLRLLLQEPLPLNEGLLRAVKIDLPPGLLNPSFPDDPALAPAVVGGNVETSQRLVDTLLKALGLAAGSQGTMNNLIFGNSRYGYYETLGGGCGAGPGFDGASAVHSHMTNTRITDPEILEQRYPVRIERFAVRKGSGGAGRHRGGDGLIRELTFLEPAELSLLTQHRVEAPYGLAGGSPGARGAQRVLRAEGGIVELRSIDGCEVEPGDRLVIETPGGGGYGETD
jgi:5-oxoprolinase (ATP-hydrolysing)